MRVRSFGYSRNKRVTFDLTIITFCRIEAASIEYYKFASQNTFVKRVNSLDPNLLYRPAASLPLQLQSYFAIGSITTIDN